MVDLIKDFGKYEKTITQMVLEWKDAYFKSNVFIKLRNRYDRLRGSLNLAFPTTYGRSSVRATNEFLSKIAFPLVRERYLLRRAIIKKNYRQDPLISIDPTGSTPLENALTLQDVLNLNLKATKFRPKCFENMVDYVSAYGVSPVFSLFERPTRKVKRTISTPLGPQQQIVPEERAICSNHIIHPLNYFQTHTIADPDDADVKGFIERIAISELISRVMQAKENYIKENVEWAIKEAKSSALKDQYYHQDDRIAKDWSKSGLDIARIWAKCPIEDNEDDETTYYIEMVGDKIIRFQDNPNDEDICNITITKIRNHREFWWGNTDSEDVFPHENFYNLFMNLKADQAIKTLERYVFYPKGAIDTADIQNRHINGGWIPVDVKPGQISLPNMLWEFQGRDNSMAGSDWLLREIKESAQKMSARPDFLRHGNKGGLANNTATAAEMIGESGEFLENDMLEIMSYGLSEIGRKDAILLIQNLGEQIAIRPDPKVEMKEFYKDQIIGQYAFTCESSLQKSNISEAIRLQNVLTAILNFKGTADPSWQNVNITPIVRSWIRKLDVGDVDEVYPEQNTMNVPGYTPSAILPGMENAGAVQELSQTVQPEAMNVPA